MTEKVRKVSVDAHFVAPEEEPTFQEWVCMSGSFI